MCLSSRQPGVHSAFGTARAAQRKQAVHKVHSPSAQTEQKRRPDEAQLAKRLIFREGLITSRKTTRGGEKPVTLAGGSRGENHMFKVSLCYLRPAEKRKEDQELHVCPLSPNTLPFKRLGQSQRTG